MTDHPHGGVGSNQYQVRGHSVSQDHQDIPHPDLMSQVQPDAISRNNKPPKLPGRWRLGERFRMWRSTHHLPGYYTAKNEKVSSVIIEQVHNPWLLDRTVRQESNVFVLHGAVSNPHLAPPTMEYLSHHKSVQVRACLAGRDDLPDSVAVRLAHDSDGLVRMELADHTRCPEALVAIVKNDPNKSSRWRAINNPACPPQVRALAEVTDDYSGMRRLR